MLNVRATDRARPLESFVPPEIGNPRVAEGSAQPLILLDLELLWMFAVSIAGLFGKPSLSFYALGDSRTPAQTLIGRQFQIYPVGLREWRSPIQCAHGS